MNCCASSHVPSDTACRDFFAGTNGRCVYCDHETKCHPGPGATCEIGQTDAGRREILAAGNRTIAFLERMIAELPQSPFQQPKRTRKPN